MARESIKTKYDHVICNGCKMDMSNHQPGAGKGYICGFCEHRTPEYNYKQDYKCQRKVNSKDLLRFSIDKKNISFVDDFGKTFFEVCTKFKPASKINPLHPELIRITIELTLFMIAVGKKGLINEQDSKE